MRRHAAPAAAKSFARGRVLPLAHKDQPVRKTLVAALLAAGLAGSVHAQSNVTIYGLVDYGATYVKASGQDSRQAIDSGTSAGSRLGFRGTEDIGNGTKVGFVYEMGMSPDSGSAFTFSNRASWVNVVSSLGEIRVGRQDGLGFGWLSAVSPFGTTYGQASMNTLFGYSQISNRLSNALFYYSPNLGGLDFALGYSGNITDDETVENDSDQRALNAGLRYKNGPLLAMLVYEQKNYANNLSSTGRDNAKSLALGGTYDFGAVKVHAAYGQLRKRNYVSSAEKEKSWLVGLSAPIGQNGSLFGTYQHNKGRNENVYGAAQDDAVRGFALGYTHKLSKRTNLYVFGSRYNDTPLPFTGTENGTAPVGTGAAAGGPVDQNQFGAGIVHRF